jgi:hypothetical protein
VEKAGTAGALRRDVFLALFGELLRKSTVNSRQSAVGSQ